jgi:hypothetical protein
VVVVQDIHALSGWLKVAASDMSAEYRDTVAENLQWLLAVAVCGVPSRYAFSSQVTGN